MKKGNFKIIPCGLYETLPNSQITDVFKPTPPGYRKVVFSTDIAETSLMIPGIKYVVDTGMVKRKCYNSICKCDVLCTQRISKVQADQRVVRAGRESNGICYRLYTVEEQEKFNKCSPEILRCGLSTIILQMIAIGTKDIHYFNFIDKPPVENINTAIEQLKLLDGVIEIDGELELSECGKKMVMFPLDVKFSKMIVTSETYGCTDEILAIISLLSVESIFYTTLSKKWCFFQAKRNFASDDSDHIMLLNIFRAYENAMGNVSWCYENFISSKCMRKAVSIKEHLSEVCEKIGIRSCSSEDTEGIRKCLASGLFMNTAVHLTNTIYKTIEGNLYVRMHPSSSLFKSLPSDYYLYTELVESSDIQMRHISKVSEECLQEVAPAYFEAKLFSPSLSLSDFD